MSKKTKSPKAEKPALTPAERKARRERRAARRAKRLKQSAKGGAAPTDLAHRQAARDRAVRHLEAAVTELTLAATGHDLLPLATLVRSLVITEVA
jgi:hypothetical protein